MVDCNRFVWLSQVIIGGDEYAIRGHVVAGGTRNSSDRHRGRHFEEVPRIS